MRNFPAILPLAKLNFRKKKEPNYEIKQRKKLLLCFSVSILRHQWLNRKMCSSRKFDPENNLVDLLLLVVHNKSVWYWHPTIFHKVSSEWEASVECQWFLFNFSLKWDFLHLYFTARIKFSWQWMILLEELKSEEWLQLLYQQLLLHNICYIWFVKF